MTLNQDFYTKKDLCELFGKTPRTIERWVKLGLLPQRRNRLGLWSAEAIRNALSRVGKQR